MLYKYLPTPIINDGHPMIRIDIIKNGDAEVCNSSLVAITEEMAGWTSEQIEDYVDTVAMEKIKLLHEALYPNTPDLSQVASAVTSIYGNEHVEVTL